MMRKLWIAGLGLAINLPGAAHAAQGCGYAFTITAAQPGAEPQTSPLGLMLMRGPNVRIELDALDEGLIALTGGRNAIMLRNKVIETEVRLADDIGPEVKGDRAPAYMPDGIVLRSGADWFVGGQATFNSAGQGEIHAGPQFLAAFLNTGRFEIWHRGTQRLTVGLVPDRGMDLATFRQDCMSLFIPAELPAAIATVPVFQPVGIRAKPELVTPSLFDGTFAGNPLSSENVRPGSAEFRVTISRGGRVRQCNVGKVTGNIALRPEACERLRKGAQFVPATNAAGEPVQSDLTLVVRWPGAPRS
ncbi:energy transducer TonB [Novosphingobium sp.]|uniref:energy transducer TonB n=1 Tax=Novosphingobium sp. TaxID=1874826 RepID=UPI0027329820|nr:hypothetical protein [Novosphingobium sp.]MDP3906189.1 hypothetical protein [Novosphingobium sp.]